MQIWLREWRAQNEHRIRKQDGRLVGRSPGTLWNVRLEEKKVLHGDTFGRIRGRSRKQRFLRFMEDQERGELMIIKIGGLFALEVMMFVIGYICGRFENDDR